MQHHMCSLSFRLLLAAAIALCACTDVAHAAAASKTPSPSLTSSRTPTVSVSSAPSPTSTVSSTVALPSPSPSSAAAAAVVTQASSSWTPGQLAGLAVGVTAGTVLVVLAVVLTVMKARRRSGSADRVRDVAHGVGADAVPSKQDLSVAASATARRKSKSSRPSRKRAPERRERGDGGSGSTRSWKEEIVQGNGAAAATVGSQRDRKRPKSCPHQRRKSRRRAVGPAGASTVVEVRRELFARDVRKKMIRRVLLEKAASERRAQSQLALIRGGFVTDQLFPQVPPSVSVAALQPTVHAPGDAAAANRLLFDAAYVGQAPLPSPPREPVWSRAVPTRFAKISRRATPLKLFPGY